MRLSKTEEEIMDFFWETGEKHTFAQLLSYWNDEREKSWSKQTLNTYLRSLIGKGAVERQKVMTKARYYPLLTKAEYLQSAAEDMLEESYDGRIRNLLTVLAGAKELGREELRQFIEKRLDLEEADDVED